MHAEVPSLSLRPRHAHKGMLGTVLIVAGSAAPQAFMPGAAALAARGSLRSGAGLVRVVCPAAIAPVVVGQLPSLMCATYPCDEHGAAVASHAVEVLDGAMAMGASAIVIGCGLGRSEHARAMVYRVLHQQMVPVIIDADALHALAAMRVTASEVRCPMVLTPHPGEFAVLARELAIAFDAQSVSDDERAKAAELAAQRLGCIVVLKGHRTVVTNGHETWVCERGHPCMATAGSGDVLAGAIGALVAAHYEAARRHGGTQTQGLQEDELASLRLLALAKLGKSASDIAPAVETKKAGTTDALTLLECAKVAVHAHACAGERWAKDHRAQGGMLASELADILPQVLGEMTREP